MFHDMGFGWMGFGWIFWLIVIAVIVYLIIKITNQKQTDNIYPKETPLEILKKRYAKGEISKEEFERIKKDIS
ncbi:SHOCT domain-containing protein [Melioribacter sp. Ez-97]|uniref:SHOCT domain-containing protein n=1 Tax=Melioribacter sp. Ez-97 TaxID=3423434 RepID=UPI003EDACF34